MNATIKKEARTVFNQVVHVEEKSFVHDRYKPIAKQLKNIVIPFSWIWSFPNEYQKLLERQADFVLEDNRWLSETTNGEFADITCFNEDPNSDHVSLVKSTIFDQKIYKKSQVTLKNAGKIALI